MERIEVEDRTMETAPPCACGASSAVVVPTIGDEATSMCWPCADRVVEAIEKVATKSAPS